MRRSLAVLSGRLLAAIVLILTLVPVVSGQESQVTGAPPSNQANSQSITQAKQKTDKNSKKTPESGPSNDRLFYALPNFLTVQGSAPPLTPAEKFKLVARGSFDRVEFVWYGALAGVSQAENSEPGYGQGAAGFGKRYGAAFADGTIENFMVAAVVPSILRQDPRFYRSGQGTFWHRAGYAMSRIVVTRSDSGRAQFNFSEIIGSALSSGISTYSYHPRADRTLPNTADVWGTQVGYDMLLKVVGEFWPDIHRKLHKSRAENP
ncbi:MAG TPA: hypothetical protein VMF66_12850 [Candidatus Acidoferrum sp.]|nr:hypothetical protein [Candidatus Acidoferrum sp.]